MKCDARKSMLVVREKQQDLAAVTLWGRYGSWLKIEDKKVGSKCHNDGCNN